MDDARRVRAGGVHLGLLTDLLRPGARAKGSPVRRGGAHVPSSAHARSPGARLRSRRPPRRLPGQAHGQRPRRGARSADRLHERAASAGAAEGPGAIGRRAHALRRRGEALPRGRGPSLPARPASPVRRRAPRGRSGRGHPDAPRRIGDALDEAARQRIGVGLHPDPRGAASPRQHPQGPASAERASARSAPPGRPGAGPRARRPRPRHHPGPRPAPGPAARRRKGAVEARACRAGGRVGRRRHAGREDRDGHVRVDAQGPGVDLATATVRLSLDVAREPRGVVVRPDGASAYVTHLVGDRGDPHRRHPRRRRRPRTASRSPPRRAAPRARARREAPVDASLAYAGVLSPDGARASSSRATRSGRSASGRGSARRPSTSSSPRTTAPPRAAHPGRRVRSRRRRPDDDVGTDVTLSPTGTCRCRTAALRAAARGRASRDDRRARLRLVARRGRARRVVELDARRSHPSTRAPLSTSPGSAGTRRSSIRAPSLPAGAARRAASRSPRTRHAYVFCRATYDSLRPSGSIAPARRAPGRPRSPEPRQSPPSARIPGPRPGAGGPGPPALLHGTRLVRERGHGLRGLPPRGARRRARLARACDDLFQRAGGGRFLASRTCGKT